MVYADYTFYTEAYGGKTISAGEWPALALRASAFVDKLTYGRLAAGADVTDEVRLAVCAVAEAEATLAEAGADGARGIAAENNDGYSVSYESAAARAEAAARERLAVAELFLRRGDPLRYAGAGPC